VAKFICVEVDARGEMDTRELLFFDFGVFVAEGGQLRRIVVLLS